MSKSKSFSRSTVLLGGLLMTLICGNARADQGSHALCVGLHPELYQYDHAPKPQTYPESPTNCYPAAQPVHLSCPNGSSYFPPVWVCAPFPKPPTPSANSAANPSDPEVDAIRSCLASLDPMRASPDGTVLFPTSRDSAQSTPLYDDNGEPLMDDRTNTQVTKITKVKQPGVYSITSDGKIYFSACAGKSAYRQIVYPDPVPGMTGNSVTMYHENLNKTYGIAVSALGSMANWSVITDTKKPPSHSEICKSERSESAESRAYFASVLNYDINRPDASRNMYNDDGSIRRKREYWVKRLDNLNACRSKLTPFADKVDPRILPAIGTQAATISKNLGLDGEGPAKASSAGSAASPH